MTLLFVPGSCQAPKEMFWLGDLSEDHQSGGPILMKHQTCLFWQREYEKQTLSSNSYICCFLFFTDNRLLSLLCTTECNDMKIFWMICMMLCSQGGTGLSGRKQAESIDGGWMDTTASFQYCLFLWLFRQKHFRPSEMCLLEAVWAFISSSWSILTAELRTSRCHQLFNSSLSSRCGRRWKC